MHHCSCYGSERIHPERGDGRRCQRRCRRVPPVLPASDLRRVRRVCKEWRDVISDPAFIDEHTVHGPRALTHTVVFFPGRSWIQKAEGSDGGSGFLFDEQWRLTATFTADRSEDMIGTCNGLLCFLDRGQGSITVVEPFTGESLALPLPPETRRRHKGDAYCFGFDPGSRRYKIVHKGFQDGPAEQAVHVCTVGGGESWRSVHVAGGETHRGPACADGAVYWIVAGEDRETRIARLDLATEEVTCDSMWNLITPALSTT
ncbi:putative F-box protein At3g16210 [Aegilops tauschii subsp. strangulata]|uniref:putative F-box protein At3g16210 n=1 Tax=Aegilops tauschii subsp. strangulata TaxID=200361 RepID=UPI00098B7DD0|nr:putative F-box protein At3g21120 [Aegilops tauschii subsp. strangulata]